MIRSAILALLAIATLAATADACRFCGRYSRYCRYSSSRKIYYKQAPVVVQQAPPVNQTLNVVNNYPGQASPIANAAGTVYGPSGFAGLAAIEQPDIATLFEQAYQLVSASEELSKVGIEGFLSALIQQLEISGELGEIVARGQAGAELLRAAGFTEERLRAASLRLTQDATGRWIVEEIGDDGNATGEVIVRQGAERTTPTTGGDPSELSFVKANCAQCHGTDLNKPKGSGTGYQLDKNLPISRSHADLAIGRITDGSMPPPAQGEVLSDVEKAALIFEIRSLIDPTIGDP